MREIAAACKSVGIVKVCLAAGNGLSLGADQRSGDKQSGCKTVFLQNRVGMNEIVDKAIIEGDADRGKADFLLAAEPFEEGRGCYHIVTTSGQKTHLAVKFADGCAEVSGIRCSYPVIIQNWYRFFQLEIS